MTMRHAKLRVLSTLALFLTLLFSHVYMAAAAQPSDTAMATGIVVKYRVEPQGAALNARVGVATNVARARGLELSYGRNAALSRKVMRLREPRPVQEVRALADALVASDPEIESAEPNVVMHPAMVPNDPQYAQQWHYFETAGGARLPNAWDLATGTGVRVAVIDTGYLPHADLAANLLPGYDFMTNPLQYLDGDGRDSDASDPGDGHCGGNPSSWHGTHVAGTIAAATNNGTGVAGVAFNSQIVPVRVLGCSGEYADIADAIIWAAGGSVPGVPANPYPARVLNLSLGGGQPCFSFMQDAVNTARSLNAVVVVSAGNSNADAAGYTPGNCSGVITVAATNRAGGRAFFGSGSNPPASNFGTTVEIAAPGGETYQTSANGVLSTLNTGTTDPVSDNYVAYQGTSMAAPHVAGVAALMLSVNSSLTPDQVVSMLQSTARPFPGTCSQCGSGILHATNAVRAALGLPSLPDGDVMTLVSGGMGPAWGYQQGAFGSLTPNVTPNGKTYNAIYAWYNYWTGAKGANMTVCGFTSNPGSGWLTSWTNDGTTRLGSAVNTYSYGSGCATWSWNVTGWLTFSSQQIVVHQ